MLQYRIDFAKHSPTSEAFSDKIFCIVHFVEEYVRDKFNISTYL